jgi:hypothetical protein
MSHKDNLDAWINLLTFLLVVFQITEEEEEEKQEAPATTLDSYFIKNNANFK